MENKELITIGMLGVFHNIPSPEDTQMFINVLKLLRGINNPKILEVGTYAGVTITNIANMFPNASCYAIDNFSLHESELQICKQVEGKNFSLEDVKIAFLSNTEGKNITLIEKDSTLALKDLISKKEIFDFIYIDGSHTSIDTAIDIVLSWLLLSVGGILAIDDYLFIPFENKEDNPKKAVHYFLKKFEGEYTILNLGYRIFLQKKI